MAGALRVPAFFLPGIRLFCFLSFLDFVLSSPMLQYPYARLSFSVWGMGPGGPIKRVV